MLFFMEKGNPPGPFEQPAHTMFAAQAVGLAQQFAAVMAPFPIGAGPVYSLDMSAPEGLSTGGGTQSLQHIKLVPNDQSGTIVLGSADQQSNEAKLRTWQHIDHTHRARFQNPPAFSEADYADLCEKIRNYLLAMRFSITEEVFSPPMVAAKSETKPSATLPTPGWPTWAVAGAAGGAMFVIGILATWLVLR